MDSHAALETMIPPLEAQSKMLSHLWVQLFAQQGSMSCFALGRDDVGVSEKQRNLDERSHLCQWGITLHGMKHDVVLLLPRAVLSAMRRCAGCRRLIVTGKW